MPNRKISELSILSNPSPGNFVPVVSGTSNFRVALSSITGSTNLSQLTGTSTLQLSSSTGNSITLQAATSAMAGLMSAQDKINLTLAVSTLSAYGFFENSPTVPSITYEYFSLAGGGGGGAGTLYGYGGGGGAGGYVNLSAVLTPSTNILIDVGGGGTGTQIVGGVPTGGSNGDATTGFFSTAQGGGKGGNASSTNGGTGSAGANGGSGGGGGSTNVGAAGQGGSPGGGTQGYSGGYGGVYSVDVGGGGGGAGGAGVGGGDGGFGGTAKTWFGGSYGPGGTGGGGAAGGANTGAGGGGGDKNTSGSNGGNGGSGIVIIRYPGLIQRAIGGSISQSVNSTFHTFTTTGTFKWLNS